MKILEKKHLLTTTLLAGAAFALSATSVSAQVSGAGTTVEQLPSAEEIAAETDQDEVVVTGSRLRRSSFNSPSPLTVLDVEASRDLGVTSINELVGRSTVVNGNRIDSTLNSNAGNSNATEAPPTGGTGSSNISLRGLGPERTLVLLNGRRLAATGVRGAPAQPDIGLIPFTLVDRVDIVTEAGSSIYGADAVGGVVNVVLRDDFEGFEVSGQAVVPQHDGGEETQVGALFGAQGDRARLTFGAEYYDRNRVLTGQRDFSQRLRNIEIDQNTGEIYTNNYNGFFDNAGFNLDTFDVLCYTPGQTGGAGSGPDFSNCGELTPPNGQVDQGDSNFAYFDRYNDNDERRQSDLVGESERLSILTSGEYDLNLFGNDQVYFEAFYFNRQNKAIGALEQIFPEVTAMIDEVDADGNVIGQVDNPYSPLDFDFAPIITLDDIPQTRDVELQQIRLVGGYRGDLDFGWFGENDWRFDAYASYDRGTGFQSQKVLSESNFERALDIVQNPDGSISCRDVSVPDDFGQFTRTPCVPVNLMAESIFVGGANGNGGFETQAEIDYLTGLRTNRTAIDQYVASVFLDGNIATSPWGGDISVGFGYEHRFDRIDSQNSINGVQGDNAAENPLPEGNTRGSRSFNEVFGEINIPLITDKPGIELLNIDGAIRQTEESSYSGTTYRVRGQYRPVDWISLSGGYGTSFRAPNLREQFLADQGGGVSGDPCVNAAIQQSITASDQGDGDPAIQQLIAQCQADGIIFTDDDGNGNLDTTPLGSAGVVTIPTSAGGNPNLSPERSTTFTLSASVEQPWFDAFDFRAAVSYYDISIEDSVEEPTFAQIVGNCYFDSANFPNQTSPFCDLITRSGGNPQSNFIENVDLTFFNIGEITAKGFDVNTEFQFTPMTFRGSDVDFGFTTAWAIQTEQVRQEDALDPATRDDNLDEVGTPKLRVNLGTVTRWENIAFNTSHRFIGAQDGEDLDKLGAGQQFNANPFIPSGPISREVNFVDSQWIHDASFTYSQDTWSASVGVQNVFDKEPPLIDRDFGFQRNNAVTSSGYDLIGRRFFVNATKSF